MYAIVDIETTGGHASGAGITEVSIRIHDGTSVRERFDSLVYPGMPIPPYIQALTGIDDAMVARAPAFEQVAPEIYRLLEGKVFVAHNVQFDYSFLKHHLGMAGLALEEQKLCTVRLSRNLFPGLPSYSLGNLCRRLGIGIRQRHRASGDCDATVELFELLLRSDEKQVIQRWLRQSSRDHFLPMNLQRSHIEALPHLPGVYYFLDQKGKVLYVGKARDLRKRVLGHFTHHSSRAQRQEFLRRIHRIRHEVCGSEFMALMLEAIEIKRLWPPLNRSHKHPDLRYGFYSFEDQNGYLRLAINRSSKQQPGFYSFHYLHEGQLLLRNLIREFQLCVRLCFVQRSEGPCQGRADGDCLGACEQLEAPGAYNLRVRQAMDQLRETKPSFALCQPGRQAGERGCVLVLHGRATAMGYLPEKEARDLEAEALLALLEPCPDYPFLHRQVLSYAVAHPEDTRSFGIPASRFRRSA